MRRLLTIVALAAAALTLVLVLRDGANERADAARPVGHDAAGSERAPAPLAPAAGERETVGDAAVERRAVDAAPARGAPDAAPGDAGARPPAPPPPLETVHVLRGVVTDAATGAPIAGARVAPERSPAREAFTDARGAYELADVALQGAERVVAEHPEYASVALPLTLVDGERLDFALPRVRRVLGRAVDPDGAPIAGVEARVVGVEIVRQSYVHDRRSARTGADGRFDVRGLRADLLHALVLVRDGFGGTVLDLPDAEEHAAELDVGDVVLARSVHVRGTVVDPWGAPVPHAQVWLRGVGPERARLGGSARPWVEMHAEDDEARADETGAFAFDDVAPGLRSMFVRTDGARWQEREVHVSAGEPTAAIEIVCEVGLALAGVVVDEDGEPVQARLDLTSEDPLSGFVPLGRSTAPSGTFHFGGLPPGTYRIAAGASARPELAPAALDGLQAGREDLRLVLRALELTRGTVVDASGAAVPGALVVARASGGGNLAVTGTDEHGAFELRVDATDPFDVWATTIVPTGGVLSFDAAFWDEARERSAIERSVAAGTTDLVLELPASDGG